VKKGIINQCGGLGDVIFSYKIADHLIQNKLVDRVEWPVPHHYLHLNDYFINENIIFCEMTAEYESLFANQEVVDNADFLYLPIAHNTDFTNRRHPRRRRGGPKFDMTAKYKFLPFDITPHNRQKSISLKRNKEREDKLITYVSSKFSLDLESKFNLVNLNFGSGDAARPANLGLEEVTKNGALPFLKIERLASSTIFDWIPFLLKCNKFYSVETSFTHLFDLLRRKNAVILPRHCPGTDPHPCGTSLWYCKKYYNQEWNKSWEFREG
jgi:hypothetical protein